jgi:hypothetical protein
MVAVRGARGGGALPLAATRVDTPHRRLHDAAAWSAGGAGDLTVIITGAKARPTRRVWRWQRLMRVRHIVDSDTCRLSASHIICSRVLCRVRCFPS